MLAQSSRPTHRLQSLPPMWGGSGHSPLSRRVLDQLQIAIAVLDTQGIVVFCNARAERLARNQAAIKLYSGQRICVTDAHTERTFQGTLRQFASGNSFKDESSVLIVVNDMGGGAQPLIGAFRPLSGHPRTILMTLADVGGSVSEASLQCLLQTFHLTPAEQRLAHHLATGGCLTDAANSFGVSKHTVRNQLRSIFDKVGVQRQADLTRLMLAGCAYGGVA